jgi:hypothetical protein
MFPGGRDTYFLTRYVPPASLAPGTAISAFRSIFTKLVETSTFADFTSASTCSPRSRSSESHISSQVLAGSVIVTRLYLMGTASSPPRRRLDIGGRGGYCARSI